MVDVNRHRDLPVTPSSVTVSGWGGTPRARTHLVSASGVNEIHEAMAGSGSRGLIPRGLGRSYGDAAQRTGGTTVQIRSNSQPEWLDLEKGIVRSNAGTTVGELIRFGAEYGFFVPVTPGTRYVTLGGAIAADIHGKDHHRAGSFGMYVEQIRMLLADGATVSVDRESDPDLLNATVGGMGLTGVVLDADLRMMPVPGNRILVDTVRTGDLDATMEALTEADSSHRYSVAWIDLSKRGASMGRGVVTSGSHTIEAADILTLGEPLLEVPKLWRIGVVNRATVGVFNELWFRKAPRSPRQGIQTYAQFFYPLDALGSWNRVYGSRGFLQYQFVLPFQAEDLLPGILEALVDGPVPVALAVLKRLGADSDGMLSFPLPGWTLAADIPIPGSPSELEATLRSIDLLLVGAGGRVYLAKDSRLGSDLVGDMYPKLAEFHAVRDRVDPERQFQSDLAIRLGL
jgi:decaprenylphospho-beta-D-ribofuranose 2-oxidase